MIYYVCRYTPLELFAAFPVPVRRLEYTTDSFETADQMGHPNMCGYGKGILEAVKAQDIRELVLMNCCDVMRRVYDILKKDGCCDFLYLLDFPHKNGEKETRLFAAQLKKLLRAYEEYSGLAFQAGKLSSPESRKVCEACPDMQEKEDRPGQYVSLQGAHCGMHLFDRIGQHFSVPVYDDTCTGNRDVRMPDMARADSAGNGPVDTEGVFLSAYAQALLGQTPCMRMTDNSGRSALGRGARGIIYHSMKFCDYYGFGKTDRRDMSVQYLKIDTDGTKQSEGQLATRLDAFAESLGCPVIKTVEKRGTAMTGEYTAGVDSGSSSTDVVILDREKKIVSRTIVKTGAGAAAGAEKALQEALEKAGLQRSDLRSIVSTGYGRDTIGIGDRAVTEITCHARGAHYLDPDVRTIIDIGGQDSKVIRIDENGAVLNFAMNDKCAAGTGRFLEMMAGVLGMPLPEMCETGLRWKKEVSISSMCTVFAESEVVSLIAVNTSAADIIHGLNKSVANRTASLLKRVGGENAYMMTGGVAANRGVVHALEEKLGEKIVVSDDSQLCGAIGAALIAAES